MKCVGMTIGVFLVCLFIVPLLTLWIAGPGSMIVCEGWSVILHGHGDGNCIDVWHLF